MLIRQTVVSSALGHIVVDLAGAVHVDYFLGDYVFVDLRLPFGRWGVSGWQGVIASVIERARQQTTGASGAILAASVVTTAPVSVSAHGSRYGTAARR